MNIRHWILVSAIGAAVLAGCSTPGEQLAAVGLFTPTGLRGEKHCETSDHCVIRTDESGLTHVSIRDQSAVMVGFSGRGGDVRHYFDYLVTIENIGENELAFDPNDVDGYDEDALLAPIKKREKDLAALYALTGISMALGNVHNIAGLKLLGTWAAQDRTMAKSHFSAQKLSAQVIPPGGVTAGRLIVKSDGEIPDKIVLSIPVGPDIHTVSFDKRDLGPVLQRQESGSAAYVPNDFSFDGRWLSIWSNGSHMDICFIRTEGSEIYKECESGSSVSGTFSGAVATFPPSATYTGTELTVIDQNTLKYKPLRFREMIGTGVYERQ